MSQKENYANPSEKYIYLKKEDYFHVAELEKIKAGGCVKFTADSAKAVAAKKNACLQTFV